MGEKQKILLVGATGETGTSILDGLAEGEGFDVAIFVQPSSASKPAVLELKEQGYPIVVGDLKGDANDLVPLLNGIDTVISAIGPSAQLDQLPLVDAAKKAGVKRFVPCGFTTICPRGGIMLIRDEKEEVHDRIFKHHLPYTIIDVGFWHQISFPHLPSGKGDYADQVHLTKIYGDGNAPNLLTDERDIGRFVARIVKDPRTLNKKVFTYSDELSQNQIWDLVERLSGEKLVRENVSAEEVHKIVEQARSDAANANASDFVKKSKLYMAQYANSKYIRRDNSIENAKYLGYVDARELYPDFEPVTFEQFISDLLNDRARKVYPYLKLY